MWAHPPEHWPDLVQQSHPPRAGSLGGRQLLQRAGPHAGQSAPPPPFAKPPPPPTPTTSLTPKSPRPSQVHFSHNLQGSPPNCMRHLPNHALSVRPCCRTPVLSCPRGMKRRTLSFRITPGHRNTIIALQNSTECCLEFTATAAIEGFMGCLVGSTPPGCRLATQYIDNLGCLDEPSITFTITSRVQSGGG